jgi:hypothetical protein
VKIIKDIKTNMEVDAGYNLDNLETLRISRQLNTFL